MEAAWANIVQTPLLKTVSGDAFSKQAAEEKHISRREKAFVSMVASSMSKVSIFSTWQLGQLEALVPMTSLTSISTNIVDRIGFEDSNETNIILNKLKSQQFDVHRAGCYLEYSRRIGLSSRTFLLVLDGAIAIHEKDRTKCLHKGQSMVLTSCDGTKSASALKKLHSSETDVAVPSELKFAHISYSTHNVFFMMVSEAAIQSVARTKSMMSSNVEFSLHGDAVIRSQAITLDALGQAMNCETQVFCPGEVLSTSVSDGTISVIVCGQCSKTHGENLAARFHDTCDTRQIAQTESLSASQAIFFAVKRKSVALNAIVKQTKQSLHSASDNVPTGLENNDSEVILLPDFSAEKLPNEFQANHTASPQHCSENPFLMMLPSFSGENFEGGLPQSPAVRKKKDLLISQLNVSTAVSAETKVSPELNDARRQITKNTAFWGYTPDLQKPLSNSKFYWGLIRLFVHACKTKFQCLLETGQPLDSSSLCSFRNERRKIQVSYKFFTISVVYKLPCDQARLIFDPCLHSISRVAVWHNDLCEKPYFRSAENVQNLFTCTQNLNCFSNIPESTRRLILNRCSFEVWPPGALILSTISKEPRMCFMISGEAKAFSSLQKDAIHEIENDENITHHYLAGEVLSQLNINFSYTNESRKSEHVYAGLDGAKVLSIPQRTQLRLLKPLWDEEMRAKVRCFQSSQLSDGFSESTLIKVMSQSRFVDISEQKQFELSDTCLYFVVDGFVRVSGSAQMSVNHQVGKSLMKEKFSENGMVSMVDASSFPSRLENTLKRKLAASPKYSQSHLNFRLADYHSPHLFRVCSHHSTQKCPLGNFCWKFADYSCPLTARVLEVQLQFLPQNNLPDILRACNAARNRLWNLYLQIKSSAVRHLDTSSGHASVCLDTIKPSVRCQPLVKTRIDKLAVPFERFQVVQKACDFTIYSQNDHYQEVLDTAAELKAVQAARSKSSTIEKLKLNRLPVLPKGFQDEHGTIASKPLELNSFLYDAAAIACPSMIHKEQTELRSISSQPRTSSLRMWSKGLNQMAVSVVDPSKRVLFLADKEHGFDKLSPQEENEFEEFCSVLKEQSQNPVIRDSRERRKFLAKFGDGMLKSQEFVKSTWSFDLQ